MITMPTWVVVLLTLLSCVGLNQITTWIADMLWKHVWNRDQGDR